MSATKGPGQRQGWSLLSNGVVIMLDDDGEPLPDGRVVDPDWPALAESLAMAA